MAEDSPKRRKANFNEAETEVLIEQVLKHEQVLFAAGPGRASPGQKRKVWELIRHKVNPVAACPREVEDLKKRWRDLKRRDRSKLCRLTQGPGGGGGGPLPHHHHHHHPASSASASSSLALLVANGGEEVASGPPPTTPTPVSALTPRRGCRRPARRCPSWEESTPWICPESLLGRRSVGIRVDRQDLPPSVLKTGGSLWPAGLRDAED
ncbi:hypothetical protein JRQ81_000737 [Phrynocephalus forsythii]|uniref:Myb-like domain-containing protein n=1 Tax=Phrynocephalus forsythii TaxID=171643 RepID=A0A9Q0Y707_9SAUR|nr:hypothetical protein JRQ81_000737 [Phrynocephalus forsythii]